MRYWVYLKGEVPGSFEPEELAATQGFGLTTLVCPAEGEILEKNWRRAGEFEDLARILETRARMVDPPPPSSFAAPPAAGDVDAMLDQTGARLFSHVSGLMKELEARREERALAIGLQRQLAAAREELAALRERAATSDSRLARLSEVEERLSKALADAAGARETLGARDAALEEQRASAERARFELEAVRRKLNEASNDLAIRNRLVDKLSRDLSEKEVSLTKALALIRRLEQDFHRLDGTKPDGIGAGEIIVPLEEAAPAPAPLPVPASLPVAAPVPPPVVAVDPEPAPVRMPLPERVPRVDAAPPPPGAFTQDEPPAVPPYLEPPPPEPSSAQQALSKFLRKVFPGAQH